MPTKEKLAKLRRSKLEMPPLSEVAARIRDGENYRDLAIEFGVERAGLAKMLTSAGYRFQTGERERDVRRREMREHLQRVLRVWFEPWMDEAICAQTDPEAFFPEQGASTADAKKVCSGCPVRERCLQYALRNKERFGIWGAKSERERWKLMKERAA